MSRRRWFDWHSWAGVLAGLLMFVVCWSGTVATVSHEVDWLLNPAQRVEAAGELQSWGRWIAAAEQAYPSYQPLWASAPLYPSFAAEAVSDQRQYKFSWSARWSRTMSPSCRST